MKDNTAMITPVLQTIGLIIFRHYLVHLSRMDVEFYFLSEVWVFI